MTKVPFLLSYYMYNMTVNLPSAQQIKVPHYINVDAFSLSRLCMLLLKRAHIGEVQASIWPDEMIEECAKHNITLL